LRELLLAGDGKYAGGRAVDHGHDERRKPAVEGGRERQDQARRQGAEGVERQCSGAAEHARADAGLLALLGQLGLRELDLLANQLRGLLGELSQQLRGGLFFHTSGVPARGAPHARGRRAASASGRGVRYAVMKTVSGFVLALL